MCGRCKACNAELNEDEMVRKYPGTEEYCELCTECLAASMEQDDDSELLNELIFGENSNE